MKASEDHKVIVVGGGPAGLITCFWLQKFGISHLLLEKENYPREKACGDILTSKAIRKVNEIDPQFIPEMLSLGIINPIYGSSLRAQNDHTINLNFKWLDNLKNTPSCYSVQRTLFDHFLFKKLKKNPLTTIITNCSITAVEMKENFGEIKSKDGSIFRAKLLLLATGSNFNPLSKNFKIKEKDIHQAIGVRAYYSGLDYKSNYAEVLLLEKHLMPGGFYITPLGNDLFNINLVVRKDVVKERGLNLTKEFESLLNANESLKRKFNKATRISGFVGSSLFLGTKKRTICGNRFMLVGDCAGLIDLVSANGIPQAMLSGKLAAEQAKKCLDLDDFSKKNIKNYQHTLLQTIKGDLSVGKILNPILKYNTVSSIIIRSLNLLAKSSSKNSSLINLFYHRRPITLLLNPVFCFHLIKEMLTSNK